MATIELKCVSKTYTGDVRAVREATLAFRDGEFIVLVGPSGCGKSTLLRMIAGLEAISGGTVAIGGRVVNELPPKDRDVAMVFQNYALYPHMTVEKNMAFGLLRRRKHGGISGLLFHRAERRAELAAIDRKVLDTARTLGIEPLLARLPRALSGGQRQRVALGRALVREPQVFLFDEPLSNLDARLRIEMRAEIRELHRRTKASMVYVTHDQEEAMTLADRMVVMKFGVVQQFGTPGECYARPANRFVAGFVGTPVMNFIEGRIEGGAFVAADMRVTLPAARWPRMPAGPATLGVRPDQLHVLQSADAGASSTAADGASVAATVRSIERLGDRMDVAVMIGGTRMTARIENDDRLVEGGSVLVHIGLGAAHLFAIGEDGARLGDAHDAG